MNVSLPFITYLGVVLRPRATVKKSMAPLMAGEEASGAGELMVTEKEITVGAASKRLDLHLESNRMNRISMTRRFPSYHRTRQKDSSRYSRKRTAERLYCTNNFNELLTPKSYFDFLHSPTHCHMCLQETGETSRLELTKTKS
jgi:hypothetical protein